MKLVGTERGWKSSGELPEREGPKIDYDRLTKCSQELISLIEERARSDDLFRIDVVLKDGSSSQDRQKIRRVLSIESIWPKVAIGSAKLENIYWLNRFDCVEEMTVSNGPNPALFRRGGGTHAKTPRRRGWIESLCKSMIDFFFGK